MFFSNSADIKKSFYLSFAIHTTVVLVLALGPQIYVSTFGSNDIEVIKSSVRVDVVGMPKFTIKELRELQKLNPANAGEAKKIEAVSKTEPSQDDVIKKDDLVLKEQDNSKSRKSFLSLISSYSAKKVDEKKGSKGSTKDGTSSDLNSLVLEGNRISKGSSLVGEYSEEQASAFANYVQSLPEVIRRFWKLPSYLLDQGFKCRIKIYLSSKGELLKLDLIEPSGQSEFDSRAEQAIRNAAPYFPAPEEEISSRIAGSGIILGFPL